MRCGYCGKNEATKTYESVKNNKKSVAYYCMECYQRVFLTAETAEGETSLSACPYCGITKEEFLAGKLVGCAHCYRTMQSTVFPVTLKMQGKQAHRGKTPPLLAKDEELTAIGCTPEQLEKAVERARFERQCNELELIIAKLKAEDNYEDAKGYADKLSSMRSKMTVEEEFVWRARRSLSKQS